MCSSRVQVCNGAVCYAGRIRVARCIPPAARLVPAGRRWKRSSVASLTANAASTRTPPTGAARGPEREDGGAASISSQLTGTISLLVYVHDTVTRSSSLATVGASARPAPKIAARAREWRHKTEHYVAAGQPVRDRRRRRCHVSLAGYDGEAMVHRSECRTSLPSSKVLRGRRVQRLRGASSPSRLGSPLSERTDKRGRRVAQPPATSHPCATPMWRPTWSDADVQPSWATRVKAT